MPPRTSRRGVADAPFVAATVRGTARLIDAIAPDAAARRHRLRVGLRPAAAARRAPASAMPLSRRDATSTRMAGPRPRRRAWSGRDGPTRSSSDRAPSGVPAIATLLPRVMARARRGVLPLPGGGRRPASMTYVDSLVAAVGRGGRAPRRRRTRQRRRRHAAWCRPRCSRSCSTGSTARSGSSPSRRRLPMARPRPSSSAGAWSRCAGSRRSPATRSRRWRAR